MHTNALHIPFPLTWPGRPTGTPTARLPSRRRRRRQHLRAHSAGRPQTRAPRAPGRRRRRGRGRGRRGGTRWWGCPGGFLCVGWRWARFYRRATTPALCLDAPSATVCHALGAYWRLPGHRRRQARLCDHLHPSRQARGGGQGELQAGSSRVVMRGPQRSRVGSPLPRPLRLAGRPSSPPFPPNKAQSPPPLTTMAAAAT